MTTKTDAGAEVGSKAIDARALDTLLSSMADQAEVWRREAGNAGVANHTLEEQYYLGIGAGLKMAAGMIRTVGSAAPQ